MKKGGKVVQLRKEQEPVTGKIVPHSVSLSDAFFEFAPDDIDGDLVMEIPGCVIDVEILGHNDAGHLMMVWDLEFQHPELFLLEASYQALVEIEGCGELDEVELGKEVSFPILAEFSMLLTTLSRASTGIPYILGPLELYDLAWGLDDLDFDF